MLNPVAGPPGVAPAHALLRRLELLALVATIPAFYMAMLSTNPVVSGTLYGLAGLASAAVLRAERIQGAPAASRVRAIVRNPVSLLLVIMLLLSAALPTGDALDLLLVRLGAAVLTVLRAGDSLRPRFWRDGLPQLLALAIGVLGLCGLGFWWLEPRAHTFGDGLWLAFTTAATVGYGDIVPSTPAAKIFAVFVVLMGFAVLSLVTAAIAAIWVQTEERKIEQEILQDLHRQLHAIRGELAALRREGKRAKGD